MRLVKTAKASPIAKFYSLSSGYNLQVLHYQNIKANAITLHTMVLIG